MGKRTKNAIFSFLIKIFVSASPIFAQSLILKIPAPMEELPKVIYGQVVDDAIFIFEEKQSFKAGFKAEAAPSHSESLSSIVDFSSTDAKLCARSQKVRELSSLYQIIKRRVDRVEVAYIPSVKECAVEVSNQLASSSLVEQSEESAIPIQVRFFLNTNLQPNDRLTHGTQTKDSPASKPTVKIGDEVVAVNEAGFFVATLPNLEPIEVEARLEGFEVWRKSVTPIFVGNTLISIDGKPRYAQRIGVFNQSELEIEIGHATKLTSKTVLNGGVGGGTSYGKQIPGEERGDRFFTQIGFDWQKSGNQFGLRGLANFTSAPSSSVPFTITSRLLSFLEYSVTDNLVLNFGGGVEFFKAKVVKDSSDKDSLLPEEVVSPTVLLGVKSVWLEKLAIDIDVYANPLYISGLGLYLTINPSVQVSWIFEKKWVLGLLVGNETHRYPTIGSESRLQLDFASFFFRVGI